MHQRAVDDPGGDAAAWEAARAAARRLRDLRDGGPSVAVRRSIDELEDRVEHGARAAEVNRRLVERLEDVRASMITDDKADLAFAEAFARAGYDLAGPSADPESIGRRSGARPVAVAAATAAALDTWAVVRRYVEPDAARGRRRHGDPPFAGCRPSRGPRSLAQPRCARRWRPATPTRSAGSPTIGISSAAGRSGSGCWDTAWRRPARTTEPSRCCGGRGGPIRATTG